jgi:alpha-mannosidase
VGNVIVTAWKEAESGHGWILRLQNTLAKPSMAFLRFEEDVEATPTDLLERPTGEARGGNLHKIPLHQHGICTLFLRPLILTKGQVHRS